jgi:hypothetical protein
MENKKHIFASHISEIGKKNPQLEQDLNVINEMANGGNIPEKLEEGKIYKIKDFIFSGSGQNMMNNVYKINYPNQDEFKVFKIEENPLTYFIEEPTYQGTMPYYLLATDIKFNFNTLFNNVAPINANSPYLKEGETYNIDNFTIFNNDYFINLVTINSNKLFKVNKLNNSNKMYVIEILTPQGISTLEISFLDIIPKVNSVFQDGQMLDMSNYQILNYNISRRIRQNDSKWINIYTKPLKYTILIANTGEVVDVNKEDFVEIASLPKFDYQIGDEIEIDKIDTTQGRITEINLMKSLGYKSYKVVGFLPKDNEDGYFYEVVVGNSTPYHYNKIPTDKVEPKTQEPPMLVDLNLQVATQVLPNPTTEKYNFATASQNFIQQNIIGENIIFTPKFVLLESLMELNELTKGKEKDLSNDLESIINDIDSFVFEQVVTNDVKDNVREMLDNIKGGNDWENAMQYTEPIKPSKSKKSKSMPNMNINNIMNNPNLPDDIRNMLARGLESGMDTLNG